MKLVILGHFLLFYQKKKPKKQNFEKMKKIAGDIITTHEYQKSQSYDLRVPRYRLRTDRVFCRFRPFFALYLLIDPEKQHFEKNEKSTLKYYHFTHVYH